MHVRLFGTWFGPENEYVTAEYTDVMSFLPDEGMEFVQGSCRLCFYDTNQIAWMPRTYTFNQAELWLTVEIYAISGFGSSLGPLANVNFVKELLEAEGWTKIKDSFTIREEEFIHAVRVAPEVSY